MAVHPCTDCGGRRHTATCPQMRRSRPTSAELAAGTDLENNIRTNLAQLAEAATEHDWNPKEPNMAEHVPQPEYNDLVTWWHKTAAGDADAVTPKAIEYGSRDLTEMGHNMARMAGREVGDPEATELGIYFYALGKMARWTAAVVRGGQASDDTLLDLGTYCMMVRRVRQSGGWPA